MANVDKKPSVDGHWLGKTLAGGLLGLSLAFVMIGFFAWYGPGGISADAKSQFNMWIITPVWLLVFSFSYLFTSTKQAWLVLGLLNIVLYALFFVLRGGL